MVVGVDKCSFELYIVNDEKYTDYELGEKLSGEVHANGYDCFEEEVCGGYVAKEIAEKLYKDCNGSFKYVVEVDFEYTEYCFEGGTEYDMDYDFTVVSKEPTDYFDRPIVENEKAIEEMPEEKDVEWGRDIDFM